MVEISEKYNLEGIHGAEVFRDLPEGIKLVLVDGAVGEIIGNARDGAIVVLKITDCADSPGRVGAEETIYYTEVAGVAKE